MGKLSAQQVKYAGRDNRRVLLADGDNLYLQVSASGAKSWIFRFHREGKNRDLGLGSEKTLSLAEAREAARDARKVLLQGLCPIEEKKERHHVAQLEAAKSITFKDCAERYIESHKAAWKNDRHTQKWGRSLVLYAYPVLGDHPVGQIDAHSVFRAIDPIWRTKNDTASRVRGRIEVILDWATVRGYRKGDNPARFKGNLSHLLPPRNKIRKTVHMNSLPYTDMPAFWKELSKRPAPAGAMLRFTILTAARTGDTRFAVWDEIDFESAIWTIPGERMKAGREHRVPLAPEAIKILKEQVKQRRNDLIFPSSNDDKPHSENAMLQVLGRMGMKGRVTVHGFRSTFKVWSSEQTDYPNEVSEMALAHSQGDKTQEAYKRTDLLGKRKPLMENWANYCIEGKNVA